MPAPVTPDLTTPSNLAREARAAIARAVAGSGRVWLLNAVLTLTALALFVAVIHPLEALAAPFRLPWWVVAIAYGLAEILVVHLQFRRDTHSFSLSEIPLVVGLFFLRPEELLLALITGSAVALTLHRRQSLIKLVFNLANLTCVTSVAVLIFRLIVREGDPLGPAGWVGAMTAAIAADIVSLLLISVAVWLAVGRPPEVAKVVGSGTVASFFNTSLALVCVTVLWVRPDAIWLPLVLAGMMVGGYRIYGSLRQKHESLAVLYESTRPLQETPDVEAVMEMLLRQAQVMFRSERAEIVFLASEDEPAFRVVLDGDREPGRKERVPLDRPEGVWARVASEGRGLHLARPISNERLREHFAQEGIRDLAAAPLLSRDAVIGVLMVANRRSDVNSFGADDVQLLETFANHASASIENAQLVSRLRRQADDSHHLALHDALTGLPNRTMFREQLQVAAKRTPNGGFAVLLLDLDKFKEVNDTLGHHNGDRVLVAVARRLRDSVRPADIVARLGGDEFGILLEGVLTPVDATALAQRLLDALTAPFSVQDLSLEVGASIGIALFPLHGNDVDTLIQRADVAMYEAKSSYQGCAVYSPEDDSYSPARLALMGDLRHAIDEGGVGVVYQPKVDLRDGRIIGAEALVRWRHPLRGDIPPDEFVPVAEHTGLLRPLTLLVLDHALAACARWRADGYPLVVAVNLSVRSLLDAELPLDVARLLASHGLSADALELEITESALIGDPARTENGLRRLRGLGVGIAIDDYGTGYSSLAYIRRMPVTTLKIDKSFVIGMATDENDGVIVRSTIDLGRNLGLAVVAEGVEDAETWARLLDYGCEVAQGFYFGRPMSDDAFRALVRGDAGVPPRTSARPLPLHVVRPAI
jgi:diguanylate cyclase (GGDEF)-like protein